MRRNRARIPATKKLEIIKQYQTTKTSLRKLAKEVGVSYKTLWNWLHKNQTPDQQMAKDIERKVMFLKEQYPALTVDKAQVLLQKDGIKISRSGIWRTWKRYGLANRSIDEPLSPFGMATAESQSSIQEARDLLRQGNVREAARIINDLALVHKDSILIEIPEKLLSVRRRLDRLYLEFNQLLPMSARIRKNKQIERQLEQSDYLYSSALATFYRLLALGWHGRVEEEKEALSTFKKKLRRVKNNALWYLYYGCRARLYAKLLQMRKALTYCAKCRRLVHHLPSSYYYNDFASLLTFFGRFKEAEHFFKLALRHEKDPGEIERAIFNTAVMGSLVAGEYSECKKLLKGVRPVDQEKPILSAGYSVAWGNLFFCDGNFIQAKEMYLEALRKASQSEIHLRIYNTTVGLSGIAMALNRKEDGRMYLRKYLPLLKKYGFSRDVLTLRLLHGAKESISDDLQCEKRLRLLHLLVQAKRTLKISDYRQAYMFAQKQSMLGILHRWIVFFPEPVLNLLEKGKKTGLPKAILRYPIFNQSIPVYNVRFLGDFSVSKNQSPIRAKLSPKEQAVLIHLSLRAGAPEKYILLHELYQNLWPKSAHPAERLLHLLTSVKKKLMIPGHLLSISSKLGEPRLINRGLYITTDYEEFEVLLTQIKSLERAGEWSFAKKDYMRAFGLIRGAPFSKMYDPWSESMRGVICNKLEQTAMQFGQGCVAQNDRKDMHKVLGKITTIIPYSQELNNLLQQA